MKKLLALVLALAMTLSLAACGQKEETPSDGGNDGAEKVTLQIGFTTAEDPNDPYYYAANEMARILEEKSGGTMEVKLFANGQLGQEREMFEGMQMGTVEMAVMTNSYVSNFVAACGALDLPFVFESVDQAMEVLNGDFGQQLFDAFDNVGVVPLSWGVGGFRNLTTASKPVATPDDLKGMKIRCLENNTYMNTYSALGANPTPMSWGELYTALQQGTVDAEENPYAMIDDGKFYEVQKYVSETGHVFSVTMLIANKKFMDKLPPDLREIIVKASHDFAIEQRKTIASMENDFKNNCIKAGMQANELTPEQKKPVVEATKKVYAQFENELGKEIMDIARKVQK